jgi:hypothetical protein
MFVVLFGYYVIAWKIGLGIIGYRIAAIASGLISYWSHIFYASKLDYLYFAGIYLAILFVVISI